MGAINSFLGDLKVLLVAATTKPPAPDEIADAQWFAKDDLPNIPPRASIARALIDDWLARS